MKKYFVLLISMFCINTSYAININDINDSSNSNSNDSSNNETQISTINNTNIDNDGIKDFKNALDKYQFSTARKIALKNKNIIEPILLKYSNRGVTPVQWMYAEYLLNIDDLKESAKWVYIALFNTRLDLNLCLDKSITYLEKNILSSWTKIIDNAKNNNLIKQKALDLATDFIREKHKDNKYIMNKNPSWVCLYSYTGNGEAIIKRKVFWDEVYKKVMDNYFSKYEHD